MRKFVKKYKLLHLIKAVMVMVCVPLYALVMLAAFKLNIFVFLVMLALLILAIFFVPVRLVLFNPLKSLYYGLVDFWFYWMHKEYNLVECGHLDAYCADFGGGKTLSMAEYCEELFCRYNDVPVWDRGRKQFVTQKILIYSNFDFQHIPYQHLSSLAQVVNCTKVNKPIDDEMGTRTVTIIALDEASVQLNSRSFKDNIDPLFLNALLTCRHYNISLIYSSQKFNLTDKLLRDVTQRVIWCNKIWRFMVHNYYHADDLNYASNPTLVKPIKRTGFFITNTIYAAYDTLAVVDSLKKSVSAGDMLSEAEILANRGLDVTDNSNVTHRSWKLKRRSK